MADNRFYPVCIERAQKGRSRAWLALFMGLVLVTLPLSQSLAGVGGAWEFFGWYGGGCFPNGVFDPVNSRRMYLASDVTGIYRSDDAGESWQAKTSGLANLIVTDIAVAAAENTVVYAATAGGLFLSRDAGESWRRCAADGKDLVFERPGNYHAIVIDPEHAGSVVVGTRTGAILKSEDFGASWKSLAEEKYPFGPKVSISGVYRSPEGACFYATSKEGILRLDLDQRHWQKLSILKQKVTDLGFGRNPGELFAAGDAVLWASEDQGQTWQARGRAPRGIFYRLAVSDSGTLYAAWLDGWNSGVVVSEDKGVTWKKRTSKVTTDHAANPTRAWKAGMERVCALKIGSRAVGEELLFYSDYWGVFFSGDGGVTWEEKIQGAVNVAGTDIAVTGEAIYAVSMDNGLVMRSFTAESYQSLLPKNKYDPEVCGHMWRVLVNGARVVVSSSPWERKLNQVLVSEDGGETFQIVREGLPSSRPKKNTVWGEGYPRAMAADPQNGEKLYLGIDGDDGGGLFISNNGGRSWQRSEGQPGSLRIYNALGVDPHDSARLYWGATGGKGGVYVSEDQGKTWQRRLSEMEWVFDLAIAGDGTVYAGGSKGKPSVYVSHDQGRKWKLLKQFPDGSAVEGIAIDSTNTARIALSTVHWGGNAPDRFYLTEDGGKSWQDISEGLPPGSGAAALQFTPDGKTLYMTRGAGSVYRVHMSETL